MVLTFARQFGSGGHEVAEKVAALLDIPFYDKELIGIAAKESGLSKDLFDSIDERPASSLLYSLVMGIQSGNGTYFKYGDGAKADHIFKTQSDVMRNLAQKQSCIMVGRCADYILRDLPNLVTVFVHAGIDFRCERIMERYDLTEKEALELINKTDKRRSSFYNFYTNRIWGSVENYNISIDTEKIGIDNTAKLIVDYVNMI